MDSDTSHDSMNAYVTLAVALTRIEVLGNGLYAPAGMMPALFQGPATESHVSMPLQALPADDAAECRLRPSSG